MNWQDALSVGASVIASLGGAGVIIFGMSGWLGKIWAERLMASEKAAHETKLETLRHELQIRNHAELEKLKTDLQSNNHRKLTSFHERLAIYKMVVDLFADFLFDLQAYFVTNGELKIDNEKLQAFEKLRMRSYGYLAVLATQEVMDCHEKMVERILDTLEGTKPFNWAEIRGGCLEFLNAARKDLGIDESAIEYRGNR